MVKASISKPKFQIGDAVERKHYPRVAPRTTHLASRDPRFYLGMLIALTLIALVAIVTYTVLWCWGIGKDIQLDTGLLTVASASVGALAASFTRIASR